MRKTFDVLLPVAIGVCAALIILFWIVYARRKTRNPTPPDVLRTVETRIAFVLLTRAPAPEWLEFLRTFEQEYDVYVVVDNNDINCSELLATYPSVVFVQIGQDTCSAAGFWNENYMIKTEPTAWGKALYYFSVLYKKQYQHVWLCEDDVFMPSVQALKNIDVATGHADFVSAPLIVTHQYAEGSHFPQLGNTIPLPWASAMVCTCRCSSKVLKKVAAYTKTHKKLNFIEVLLPSLALSNGYTTASPPELVNILYRHDWLAENIQSTHLYHPVKDIKLHNVFRQALKNRRK